MHRPHFLYWSCSRLPTLRGLAPPPEAPRATAQCILFRVSATKTLPSVPSSRRAECPQPRYVLVLHVKTKPLKEEAAASFTSV
ncbi:hypothetical protein GUJ93_ZPchr0001g32053 [Zizania palustris]|uniref:Uncharacterized protein n=1 Tax=Zizania palustris TaxID=103762 RepID=A0A8J5UZY8_ZIZPA|nr:hypothetical protein GUJ93_ZPchr0001g32053 [Zizania palustris]